jgi:hypothetical protein
MSEPDDEERHELALLEPWRRAYRAFYGHSPELGTSAGRSTFTIRREEDPFHLFRRMIGTIGRFAGKPRLLEHVRSLGFEWDDAGVLRTVPLPASFRRRLSVLGPPSGFSPEVTVVDALEIPAGSWLVRLSEARAPIQAGTEELYLRARPARSSGPERWRRAMIHHLLSVPHDMSKHVLACHLVPRARLLDLGERVVSVMGRWKRRVAGTLAWARWLGSIPKECLAPVPLLTFYENDLVDYSHAVWDAIDDPHDFASVFARPSHYAQLVDVLSRRMEQVKGFGFRLRRGSVPPRPYTRFAIDRP